MTTLESITAGGGAPVREQDANCPDLAAEISRATRDLHEGVNKLVMARIALGLRDYHKFREGILSFFYIYKTFEEEWDRLLTTPSTLPPRKLHILRNIHAPHLPRTTAALNDLAFFFSLPSPSSTLTQFSTPTTPARIAFVDHIRSAIEKEPLVLIAYIYSLYLALFAGGKVIKSKMLSALEFFPKVEGCSTEECQRLGTHLFTWEHVEQGKEDEVVRAGLKRRLKGVEGELTAEERQAIIAESREIFMQIGNLIAELDEITQPKPQSVSLTGSLSAWLGVLIMAMMSWLAYRVGRGMAEGVKNGPVMVIGQ